MKIYRPGFLWVLILTFFLAGCGGSASAPPVDLPAPVAGFIDVSSPDADGNVTVTGSEGSVPGGAIVMIVNESASASLITPFMGFFVSNAFASDDLPAICSEPGHSCTVADSEGRFVLVIAAAEGDTLTIGIIDSDGNWISELLTQTVPKAEPEPEPEANCSEEGVAGKAVDLVVAPGGTPILLKQGSSTTTNQLVIGTGSSATEVAIEGCYARSLAMYVSSDGVVTILATSTEDKILWKGTYSSSGFSNTKSFTLDYSPIHAAFTGSSTDAVVSMLGSNGVFLARVLLLNGSVTLSSQALLGTTKSVRVAVEEMGNPDGEWIGAVLATDDSGATFKLRVFNATPGKKLDNLIETDVNNSAFKARNLEKIYDVGFWTDKYDFMRLVFVGDSKNADPSSQVLGRTMYCTMNGTSVELRPSTDALSATNKLLEVTASYISDTVKGSVRRLAVAKNPLSPEASVLAAGPTGFFYSSVLNPAFGDTTTDLSYSPVTSGNDLVAIAFDPTSNKVFVADATAGEAVEVK